MTDLEATGAEEATGSQPDGAQPQGAQPEGASAGDPDPPDAHRRQLVPLGFGGRVL